MADFDLLVGVKPDASWENFQKDITSMINDLENNIPTIKVKLEVNQASIDNVRAQIEGIQGNINGSQVISTTVDTGNLQSNMASVANSAAEATNNINGVASATENANTSAQKLKMTLDEQEGAIRKIKELIASTEKARSNWTAAEHGESQFEYENLGKQIAELNTLKQKVKSGDLSQEEFKEQFTTIWDSIRSSRAEIRGAGEDTKTWAHRVGNLAEKFTTWFSITRVIMAIVRALKQMYNSVVDIDTAMTELRKVTNETNETYDKFLDNATVKAKKLGAAVSDYVKAAADYARLGYSLADAEALADVSVVYSNVGDNINIEQANEAIISTMKGFGLQAEEAQSIVDKFNEVGNNFAIGTDGIGEALKRSSAALHTANNTLDESIALATAMNTVLQDPEKVGTTLKTVSMFLRASKTEAEAAGESIEGMANSTSELRSQVLTLTGNKVDIMLDDNTYKNTYKILQEISKVWGNIEDVDQANLLELLGGKRNANAIAAILENFDIAEEALISSQNSAGSAMAENEKYLNSIAGATKQLTAAQQSLSTTLLEGDTVVVWKRLLTTIVQCLDAVLSFGDGSVVSIVLTTSAVLSLSMAWKAVTTAIQTSTKAQKIFNGIKSAFSLKTLVIAGVITAITLLVKGIQWLSQTEERAKEKFDESINTYTETKQKLEDVNSELQTTQDRIAELNAQNSLTIVEQSELNRLKEINAELIRQKELLEADTRAGINSAQNSFISYMKEHNNQNDWTEPVNRIRNTWSDGENPSTEFLSDFEQGLKNFYSFTNANQAASYLRQEWEIIESEMEKIKVGSSQWEKLTFDRSLSDNTLTQEQYNKLVSLYEKRERMTSLSSASSSEEKYQNFIDGLTSDISTLREEQAKLDEVGYENLNAEAKTYYDSIDDIHYKMLLMRGDAGSIDSVFSGVFYSERFKEAREGIEDLGDGAKLTADNIDELIAHNPAVKELIDYYVSLGMIDPNKLNWQIQFANWINSANEAKKTTDQSLKSLENYYKELDEIRSAFNSVKSVVEDYNKNGGYLSVENYQTLINLNSDYLQCLIDENGQIKLNAQAYTELTKVQMQNMLLSKIQTSIDDILGKSAADAAKLATVANYEEVDSIYALIEAKLKDAYVTAQQKDAENNTTAFTTALKAQLPYWSSLVAFYEEACGDLNTYGMHGYDAAEANNELTKSLQKQKEELEDAQSNIQSLIDLVVDMIKKEKELEKEAYEEQKEHITDLIDERRELLEAKKEEAEFNKELSDKQNTVSQNALSASIAELDDSSAGRKATKEANDALSESRSDLQSALSDHELDTRLQSLDNLKKTTEEYYDGLIEEVDQYLDNERKLYEDACDLIDNDNGTLYSRLKKYVYNYTTQTESEFDHMWTMAQEGLKLYDDAHTPLWKTMSILQHKIYITGEKLDGLSNAANLSVQKSTAAIGNWDSTFKHMLESWEKVKEELGEYDLASSAPKWKFKFGDITITSPMENKNDAFTDILSQALEINSTNKIRPLSFGDIYNAINRGITAYATGTTSATGGLSMVGEDGPELRVLNPDDGILPTNITKNLWQLGADPVGSLAQVAERLFNRLTDIDLFKINKSNTNLMNINKSGIINAPVTITISGNATQETVDALRKLAPQIANEAAKKVMNTALQYSSGIKKI